MCCTFSPRVPPVVVGLKFWVVQNFLSRPTPFWFFPASCHVYKSTVARLKLDTNAKKHRLLHGRSLFDGFWPWLSRKALCDRAFSLLNQIRPWGEHKFTLTEIYTWRLYITWRNNTNSSYMKINFQIATSLSRYLIYFGYEIIVQDLLWCHSVPMEMVIGKGWYCWKWADEYFRGVRYCVE